MILSRSGSIKFTNVINSKFAYDKPNNGHKTFNGTNFFHAPKVGLRRCSIYEIKNMNPKPKIIKDLWL